MIACNDDGRDLFPQDELDEDFIKGAYGFRGRDGAVIDIACNEEGIDLFLPDDAHKLAKDRHLVLKEMKAMKDAPQMPVRCVEKTHDTHPFCTWKKKRAVKNEPIISSKPFLRLLWFYGFINKKERQPLVRVVILGPKLIFLIFFYGRHQG